LGVPFRQEAHLSASSLGKKKKKGPEEKWATTELGSDYSLLAERKTKMGKKKKKNQFQFMMEQSKQTGGNGRYMRKTSISRRAEKKERASVLEGKTILGGKKKWPVTKENGGERSQEGGLSQDLKRRRAHWGGKKKGKPTPAQARKRKGVYKAQA